MYSFSRSCTRQCKYSYSEVQVLVLEKPVLVLHLLARQSTVYSDFHFTWQSKHSAVLGTQKKVLDYSTADYSCNIFSRMYDEITTAYTFFHRKKLVYIVNDICYSTLNIVIIRTSYEWNKHAEFSVIKSSIVEYIITNYTVIIHTPTYVR